MTDTFTADNKDVIELVKKFQRLADKSGCKIEEPDPEFSELVGYYLTLKIPDGRDFGDITLGSYKALKWCVDHCVYHYRLIPRLEGVVNFEKKTAEVALRNVVSAGSNTQCWEAIFESEKIKDIEKADRTKLSIQYKRDGVEIELSGATPMFKFITQNNEDDVLTLKISNFRAETSESLSDQIITIGNCLFFSLERLRGVGITLSRRVKAIRLHRRGSKTKEFSPNLEVKYNQEVMDLYWNARSAFAMPLMQFLSYYQIMEYYYPKYSQIDLRNKVVNSIKDPRFNVFDDKAIDGLMGLITKGAKANYGFDERSQLKMVVASCVNTDELIEIIQKNTAMKDYLAEKNEVGPKISIDSDRETFLNNITDRIYGIRCKIVHTKSNMEDSQRAILPYSAEANMIKYDNILMRAIAQQVIFSNATKA